MKVSVIMAAFQAEATIAEAVASAIAQTHRDWELIVVDDGSTDSTARVALAAGDPRVRVIAAEHVGVLAQVRNRGIAEARGEVLALLDADDVWAPGKLEAQLCVLAERPEVGLVHAGADLLVEGARRPGPVSAPPAGPLLAGLLRNNYVYSSSVVVRRALLDVHGAFDPDPVLHGSPDYELWLRLAPHTAFAYLPEPLLLYRVHAGQMSGKVRRMELGALLAIEKAQARPTAAGALRADWLLAIGRRKCAAGEPGHGVRELVGAACRRPGDLAAWRWLARALVAQLLRRTSS